MNIAISYLFNYVNKKLCNAMKTIMERLNSIEIEAPKTVSALRKQVNYVVAAGYTKQEICYLLFDADAFEILNEVEKGTALWKEIRDIHNAIIDLYCQD